MSIRRTIHVACVALTIPALALAQPPILLSEEEQIVAASRRVLLENAAIPAQGIPRALLASASGIAIIPNVLKGGFVLGVRRGHGLVLLRDAHGAWAAPQFVTLTGGSIGWQAGIQSTDLILVFKTPSSVHGLTAGKITVGADVAAAAGPVGRNAAAATDAQLHAEIYSYSRSRGLFAGVALDGSSLQIDHAATARYYQPVAALAGNTPLAATTTVLPSALALVQEVTALTQPSLAVPAQFPIASGPAAAANLETLRQQLFQAHSGLQAILTLDWRDYLTLPVAVTARGPVPDLKAVEQSLLRFDTVAADPQYGAITGRVEFQIAHQLLRQFLVAARQSATLPPPPSG